MTKTLKTLEILRKSPSIQIGGLREWVNLILNAFRWTGPPPTKIQWILRMSAFCALSYFPLRSLTIYCYSRISQTKLNLRPSLPLDDAGLKVKSENELALEVIKLGQIKRGFNCSTNPINSFDSSPTRNNGAALICVVDTKNNFVHTNNKKSAMFSFNKLIFKLMTTNEMNPFDIFKNFKAQFNPFSYKGHVKSQHLQLRHLAIEDSRHREIALKSCLALNSNYFETNISHPILNETAAEVPHICPDLTPKPATPTTTFQPSCAVVKQSSQCALKILDLLPSPFVKILSANIQIFDNILSFNFQISQFFTPIETVCATPLLNKFSSPSAYLMTEVTNKQIDPINLTLGSTSLSLSSSDEKIENHGLTYHFALWCQKKAWTMYQRHARIYLSETIEGAPNSKFVNHFNFLKSTTLTYYKGLLSTRQGGHCTRRKVNEKSEQDRFIQISSLQKKWQGLGSLLSSAILNLFQLWETFTSGLLEVTWLQPPSSVVSSLNAKDLLKGAASACESDEINLIGAQLEAELSKLCDQFRDSQRHLNEKRCKNTRKLKRRKSVLQKFEKRIGDDAKRQILKEDGSKTEKMGLLSKQNETLEKLKTVKLAGMEDEKLKLIEEQEKMKMEQEVKMKKFIVSNRKKNFWKILQFF